MHFLVSVQLCKKLCNVLGQMVIVVEVCRYFRLDPLQLFILVAVSMERYSPCTRCIPVQKAALQAVLCQPKSPKSDASLSESLNGVTTLSSISTDSSTQSRGQRLLPLVRKLHA